MTSLRHKPGPNWAKAKQLPPTTEQIQDGIKLIGSGEGGLSCISCHDFAVEKSVGDLRGPDMTEMFGRIRTDWLRRWLREPARIQAGTAMPAFFNEMPEASAEKMLSQIAHALWAGNKMPRPAGFDDLTQNYSLVEKNEPILLRTFMPDSSRRNPLRSDYPAVNRIVSTYICAGYATPGRAVSWM